VLRLVAIRIAAGAGVAVLALAEAAFLMQGVLRAWIAIAVVAGGCLAALCTWLLARESIPLPAVALSLVLPWVGLYAAYWAQLAGDAVSRIVFFIALALPFGTATLAVLAGARRAVPGSLVLRSALCVVVAVGLGVLAAGARGPWLNDPRPEARFPLVDEVAGTYGGVGIGDTPAEMQEVFGPRSPLDENDSFEPTGAQDYSEGPWSIPAGGGFAYEDVLFWLPPDSTPGNGLVTTGRISGFELTSPPVETRRGVAMGDDLGEVSRAYPGFECGENDRGEYGKTKYCMGRLAPQLFLYFGGDPITDISVSRGPVTP
jgi:hypothetical protein